MTDPCIHYTTVNLPRALVKAVNDLTQAQWEQHAEHDALWIMHHLGIAIEPFYEGTGKVTWTASYRNHEYDETRIVKLIQGPDEWHAYVEADSPSAALRALLCLPRPIPLPLAEGKIASMRQLRQTHIAFLRSVVTRATGVTPGKRRKRALPKR